MKYFAIFVDGNKYGPVDVDTLTQWAAENRISRSTMLEEEGTGRQFSAAEIPGIMWVHDATTGMPPTAPNPTQTQTQAPFQNSMPPNPNSGSMGMAYNRPGMDPAQMSWIDKQFSSSNMVLLVILCFCCNLPMLVFSIIGVVQCQIPEAKQKANTCLIIAGVLMVLGILVRIAGFMAR
jgi:hypothetical protein